MHNHYEHIPLHALIDLNMTPYTCNGW